MTFSSAGISSFAAAAARPSLRTVAGPRHFCRSCRQSMCRLRIAALAPDLEPHVFRLLQDPQTGVRSTGGYGLFSAMGLFKTKSPMLMLLSDRMSPVSWGWLSPPEGFWYARAAGQYPERPAAHQRSAGPIRRANLSPTSRCDPAGGRGQRRTSPGVKSVRDRLIWIEPTSGMIAL
jgi:hypothetical protein